jgi:hypothetical protein
MEAILCGAAQRKVGSGDLVLKISLPSSVPAATTSRHRGYAKRMPVSNHLDMSSVSDEVAARKGFVLDHNGAASWAPGASMLTEYQEFGFTSSKTKTTYCPPHVAADDKTKAEQLVQDYIIFTEPAAQGFC